MVEGQVRQPREAFPYLTFISPPLKNATLRGSGRLKEGCIGENQCEQMRLI